MLMKFLGKMCRSHVTCKLQLIQNHLTLAFVTVKVARIAPPALLKTVRCDPFLGNIPREPGCYTSTITIIKARGEGWGRQGLVAPLFP
ncbi:hypothetical protein ElyMa_000117900 [Elysia marginata]|uniref:Secreted protein n=1 Tax=Elysia marginata TaxID=1093978 RepID=A0AAV4EMV5_9GAST|nr:hypothetical protein ElyMa_000117900 [Elysia marginata]